jgi:hypothetical protein
LDFLGQKIREKRVDSLRKEEEGDARTGLALAVERGESGE